MNILNTDLENIKEYSNNVQTEYNKTVFLTENGVTKIAQKEEGVFSNFSNISQFVSSIRYSLLNLSKYFVKPTQQQLAAHGSDFILATERKPSDINDEGVDVGGDSSILAKAPTQLYDIIPLTNPMFIRYSNYKDSANYKTIELYLPFAGIVPLDITLFYNKYLRVYMSIDISSCTGTYLITSNWLTEDTIDTTNIVKTVDFNFGIEVPVNMSNLGDFKRNVLMKGVNTAISIAVAVASKGSVVIPPKSETHTSLTEYDIKGQGLYKGSRPKRKTFGTMATTETIEKSGYERKIDKTPQISDCIENSVAILNTPLSTSEAPFSGDSSSLISGNLMNVILITKTKKFAYNDDAKYSHMYGKPLGRIETLKNLTGYTKITELHLETSNRADFSTATQYEKDLIEKTLYEGIII